MSDLNRSCRVCRETRPLRSILPSSGSLFAKDDVARTLKFRRQSEALQGEIEIAEIFSDDRMRRLERERESIVLGTIIGR